MSCPAMGIAPYCSDGEVNFSGTGYPNKVRVVVTDGLGTLDDSQYDTTSGFLSFTENLSYAGTYTVDIKHGGNLNGGTLLNEVVIVIP